MRVKWKRTFSIWKDPVAAASFGLVERAVGLLDQVRHLFAVFGIMRNADGDGDLQVGVIRFEFRGLGRLTDTLGGEFGAGKVGVRENDAEFLAAVAAGNIDLAEILPDDAARFTQH